MLNSSYVRRRKVFARCVAVLIACMLCAAAARAEDKCKLVPVGSLPVTMAGLRPLVTAQVNGKDTQFLLDSGAFFSMMSAAAAIELNLKLTPFGLIMRGVGGSARTGITAVQDFGVMGITFHNAEFLVGGSEFGAAGALGQNLLSRFDVEYDLAKGVVRLFTTEHCEKSFLAYWVAHGQSYSSMDINKIEKQNPHTVSVAYINGKKIRVMFDTGAATSGLSLKAAERLGVKIDSPGVTFIGYARGVGPGMVRQYLAVFPSFKLGDDEEIKNTRLRISDVDLVDAEMLIGADFFLSHHVYVSNSQRKLYLTYNGGPVFNLTAATSTQADGASGHAEAQTSGDPADNPADPPDAPAGAAEFARRGAASVARHDFKHGLSDLSKAIELSPDDAEYFYRRAIAYWQNGQAPLALADLDRALSLNANFLQAYIDRAEIYFGQKRTSEAIADLDSADRLAVPQADLRLRLAYLYGSADKFVPEIAQLNLWLQNHPVDSRFVDALATRCIVRALQNQDLAVALDDCNKALRLVNLRRAESGSLFADRGMVWLRQGEYAKAIDDFDDALKLQPKNAFALIGRGAAKSRMNKNNAGQSDIDAAELLAPKITQQYQRYGIAP